MPLLPGIQSFSPVDAHVTPIPDDMPGYADKIIMLLVPSYKVPRLNSVQTARCVLRITSIYKAA